MDEKDEVIELVIAADEYYEIYSPFRTNTKEEGDNKVKRGILKARGMKDEEIDRIIDYIEVQPDRGGADGMFDDGPYTPVMLVYKLRREPPIIEVPDPIQPEPEIELEPAREPRQTMLQQFYGDREAESRRNKTFDRFKSHVKKKTIDVYDEDGTKRQAEVYTVEDYEGKEQDSNELLLDGYQTRLERLSRAHQGDFGPYKREFARLRTSTIKEIIEKYEEMHEVNPIEAEKFKEEAMQVVAAFEDPDVEKEAIQALIDKDTEFIETNNYTYNRRQNTAENLKTLGKDGEKSVKAQISDEQTKLKKFGLKTMNVLIDIRNHTKAPVNKAIGTYVASPIYRALMGVTQAKSKEPVVVEGFYLTPMEDMLATSQKHSRGMFANKPTHRYTARKDFFIAQEAEEIRSNQELRPDGKVPRTTLSQLFKMAVVPRVKAVFNYREGNVALLNAGLRDIEEATDARKSQMDTKRHKLINTGKRIAAYEKEIEDLKNMAKVAKDPKDKEAIEKAIALREASLLKLEARYAETSREEIDSVSTDAISMAQHDKANKSNITKVVRGVKTAARAAAGVMISKYLYKEVAHQGKTPDTYEYIPGKTEVVEEEVTRTVTETIPGMDVESVGHITLDDIYKKGSGLLTYDAHGGNQITDKTSFFRGLAFEYEGKLFSGSDGVGFDPTKLTNVKIDQQIDGNTTLVSLVQEIVNDRTGKAFTKEQISQMIVDGKIGSFDIWRSTSEQGIPMGWLNASEIVPNLISGGSHTVTKEITEIVKRTITTPGKMIVKPGVEYTYFTEELNPIVVAAEMGLGASEIADWNELARYTRSQENIQMRQPRVLAQMKAENDKLREEKAKQAAEKGETTEKQDEKKGEDLASKIAKRREIKSFQRSNKSKKRWFFHHSERMQQASERAAETREGVTIFERFTGSKRADMKSGYDENLLGTNDREAPINDGEDR